MNLPKIYIVEDEAIVALDIEDGLTRQGYNVVGVVPDGEKALADLQSLPVDLVLMDIQIKGMLDGIETAHRIRESQSVPIIFLTANSDESILQRAKETEPYGYILKPFHDRQLHTAIEMAMFKHDQEQERLKKSYASELHSVCCNCKKIRNKDGNWLTADIYFYETYNIRFSHGYCPGCTLQLYPEIFE